MLCCNPLEEQTVKTCKLDSARPPLHLYFIYLFIAKADNREKEVNLT